MVKIYDDIELIQFPRSNEKITQMLCFDDCIATFCNYINVVYEKAYINALELDFNWCELKGIGKSYNYGTKLEDNLKQYCGIEIKSRKCDDKDKVTQIVECIDNNILVCVEVLGFNCPWDWRYQIVPQGAHYFFINGYDESKCCFNCLDPFYDVINGSISFDDLKNGMQSYDIFQIIEFEEKNQDIKELLNAISSFFDSDQFDKYYIFSQKFKTFDLNKEIENYNSEMELNVDEVENDIPLNYVFKDIIHNRLRFGEYLRRIAERNEKYSASLIEFANKYISFSQKWESTRLMLIKFLIVNRLDRITGNLAEKLELIITEEKDTLNDLLSMLKGQYEENNKLEISKLNEDLEYKFIDISAFFNNEGIASENNDNSADLNDKGEYILCDYFPVNQIINSKNFVFKITEKKKGRNDNVQCNRQKIIVDKDYYDGIQILGCSEWGNYTEELTVVFEDESIEKVMITLNDWIPNYLQSADTNVLIESKKCVKDVDITEEHCNIYGVMCGIKGRKIITCIILPECISMHIFALTMLKNKKEEN